MAERQAARVRRRVLDLAPVITTAPTKQYSPRYLSEDERVHLADMRREGRPIRDAAALMARSPSTISRELRRGADDSGRFRPFEAHRKALGHHRLYRASRMSGDAVLRDWVADRLKAHWSRSRAGCVTRSQASRGAGCARSRSTRRCTGLTSAACPASYRAGCCASGAAAACANGTVAYASDPLGRLTGSTGHDHLNWPHFRPV
jgi:hypothetical protein